MRQLPQGVGGFVVRALVDDHELEVARVTQDRARGERGLIAAILGGDYDR
jgi:hypothetical protein